MDGTQTQPHSSAAAERVRALGAVFPGSRAIQFRLALIIERTTTAERLSKMAGHMRTIAVSLRSIECASEAVEFEGIAAWLDEEVERWPIE
jgi:hypothetical protein